MGDKMRDSEIERRFESIENRITKLEESRLIGFNSKLKSLPIIDKVNSPIEEVKEDKINVTLAESDENSKYPETSPHEDTNQLINEKEKEDIVDDTIKKRGRPKLAKPIMAEKQ
jgi:hypothetical protein